MPLINLRAFHSIITAASSHDPRVKLSNPYIPFLIYEIFHLLVYIEISEKKKHVEDLGHNVRHGYKYNLLRASFSPIFQYFSAINVTHVSFSPVVQYFVTYVCTYIVCHAPRNCVVGH